MGETGTIDAVEAFLDAADAVLNSNTFLVGLPLPAVDPAAALGGFIRSGGLQKAIFAADIARGWYNLHYFTAAGVAEPLRGNLSRTDCHLTSRVSRCTVSQYLEAMLSGDCRFGDFISFYCCGKPRDEACRLADRLLARLFPESQPALHLFEPDFLQGDAMETGGAYYFEEKGCDNAALLAGRTASYLLLTNGAP